MDTTSLRWRARVSGSAVHEDRVQKDGKKGNQSLCRGNDFAIVDCVALAAVGSSCLSLGFGLDQMRLITTISSVMTMTMGPYVAYQKRLLRRLGTIRRQHNVLRQTANHFSVENERLYRKLQRLDVSMARLEETEEELNSLMPNWRKQRHLLTQIMNQQQELNDKIREGLRKQVLESVLTAVVRSDSDEDFQISPSEMELLIVRLRALPGVRFHERNFRAHMTDGNLSLKSIMHLIRILMTDKDGGNDIITLCPEDLKKYSKFLKK